MELLLFLSVVWFAGFITTVAHEFAHVVVSGGKLESLTIGIAHKHSIQIRYKNLSFYPLFPFAGISAITVNLPISRVRLVAFTLAGSLIGLLMAILFVGLGLYLLPAEALAEIHATWRLGFLMRAIIGETAGIRLTVGTAFIASGIMFGVQHALNILPVKGFDGYHTLSILRNWRWHE